MALQNVKDPAAWLRIYNGKLLGDVGACVCVCVCVCVCKTSSHILFLTLLHSLAYIHVYEKDTAHHPTSRQHSML